MTSFGLNCRRLMMSAVTAAAVTFATAANALPLTWYFSGIFDDGGKISGQFTIEVYGYLGAPTSLTTTDGSVLAGMTYSRPPNPTSIIPNTPPAYGVAFYSPNYNRALQLMFLNSLEVPGINPLDLTHSASFECFAWSCPGPGLPNDNANTRFFVSGLASTNAEALAETPLPAALPLFASGVALLGFFGRRRKKLAAAA
jgi:hypothetical protein